MKVVLPPDDRKPLLVLLGPVHSVVGPVVVAGVEAAVSRRAWVLELSMLAASAAANYLFSISVFVL